MDRQKVFFESAGMRCAAWHYQGDNSACIVMAAGLGVPKEPGTNLLAQRFHRAGFSVLAFDYRRLGESAGNQRGLVRLGEQITDFEAAVGFARTLREVDPRKVAIWGFSVSGGHVYKVAARMPDLGAAIVHAGLSDGLAATRYALRFVTPAVLLRMSLLAAGDAIATRLGRDPILIPLNAPRGQIASINTPDAQNGPDALSPNGRYDDVWPKTVAASSAMRIGFYRPGREAPRIQVPLLVLEFQDDGVTPPGPAAVAARRAPRGELVQLPGGHYAAMTDQTDAAVDAIVEFLSRHVLDRAPMPEREPVAPRGGALNSG